MISAGDFRKGTKILYKGEPYMVVDFQWTKPGKGGAYVKARMKNMISGLIHEDTFRSGEKLPQPDLEYRQMQFLYREGDIYHFLDQESYEQFSFNKDQVDEALPYMKEEIIYTILFFSERPIAVTPPLFVQLKVKETPPGVRGDTAQGGATKPATMETGLVLQVPLFVNEGETLKVDTRDGSYIERVQA
ncbi:elongation factor P [Candidatus Dependentiae bacterium]|nr:elongation factor P [Candidatus Dependentiae bacterium]